MRKHKKLKVLIISIITSIAAGVIIIPFIWMFLSAFKPSEEIMRVIPTFFPENPTFGAFKKVFKLLPFALFFRNSIIVSITVTCSVLFSSSLIGYCLAKFRFLGRDILFLLVLLTMVLPFEIIVIPLFILIRDLRMINSLQGLILPFVVDSFGIFLCTQFILGIPSDYMDAARIDGLSEWDIYLRIIIPLIKPVLSALCIFCFFWQWGFILWPLVVASSDKVKTIPLGIMLLQTQRGFIYDLTLAAASMTIAPTLIIFIIMRKYFVKGVALSGLKA